MPKTVFESVHRFWYLLHKLLFNMYVRETLKQVFLQTVNDEVPHSALFVKLKRSSDKKINILRNIT